MYRLIFIARTHFWGLIATLAVAGACFFTVLNSFYESGVTLWDTLQFATNIWRSGWNMRVAPVLGIDSYIQLHFSPVLYVPALLSYLFPGDFILYYALVYALIFAGLTFTAYTLLRKAGAGNRCGFYAALGALMLFASQPIVSGTWEMRIDYISIPFMLLMIRAWLAEQHRQAWFWLVALASVHETMALIYMPALLMLAVCQVLHRRRNSQPYLPLLRQAAIMGLFAVLYCIAAVLLQKSFFVPIPKFENDYYSFNDGAPFAHLSTALLAHRLDTVFHYSPGVWLPLLIALAAGIMRRDWVLLAGSVGFLPYLMFLLGCKYDLFAIWAGYKPFPVAAALLWPSLIAASRTEPDRKGLMALQYAMLAASLAYLPFTGLSMFYGRWMPQPMVFHRDDYHAFESILETELNSGHKLCASMGVLSLYPYRFADSRQTGIASVPREALDKIDTLIWLQGDWNQNAVNTALMKGHYAITKIPGTKIRIAHKTGG